MSVISSQKS